MFGTTHQLHLRTIINGFCQCASAPLKFVEKVELPSIVSYPGILHTFLEFRALLIFVIIFIPNFHNRIVALPLPLHKAI